MKSFLGIDPGLSGALVQLSEHGEIVKMTVMPVIGNVLDLKALTAFFSDLDEHTTGVLEKVSAMPGQGVSSMFKFGRTYGVCEAMLAAHLIPYELVTPQKWQKSMHSGIEKSIDAKKRSLMAVSRLFPEADLRKNSRCRKPHDGLVDALLLAEYGRRGL